MTTTLKVYVTVLSLGSVKQFLVFDKHFSIFEDNIHADDMNDSRVVHLCCFVTYYLQVQVLVPALVFYGFFRSSLIDVYYMYLPSLPIPSPSVSYALSC